ncbi:unnamed protein product [Blepharisma stoltei]|uniref:Uncharacterized protein n=1 Tax=Blepharisma stoltei TaxID=1481888 RepID=A0AAU9JBP2_9CILI|nr:unnamed protein product [Blepharisma stoltei]
MIDVNPSEAEINEISPPAALNLLSSMFSLLNPQSETAEFGFFPTLDLPKLDFFKLEELERSEAMQLSELQSQGLESLGSEVEERRCTHTDRKIYARNMCNHCYRMFGQNKMAWTCPHRDRQHYAKGRCQLCYLKEYHRSRVFGRRRKPKSKIN